jgi:hypothetical protein
MHDVGTAGFAGFDGQETIEVAYYSGDHSAALKPEYQDLLVDFVMGGTVEEPAALIASPGYYRQISNAMPYLVACLACTIIVTIGWLAVHGGIVQILWLTLIAIVGYVILDII